MRRREAEFGLRDRKCHRRPKESGKIPAKIPAETACFDSAWKPAVWWDWMVGATGIEPVTPCSSNRLLAPKSGAKFAYEDALVKPSHGNRYGSEGQLEKTQIYTGVRKSEFDGFADCIIIESLYNPIADA
jgi:hypothetical protein